MDIGTFLVPDSQSAKLVEPGKAPLNDPAPSAQSAAMFRVTPREERQNAAVAEALPN